MGAIRINSYSPSTDTLDGVINTASYEYIGAGAISITNYDSTIRPALAAGSIVDVAGNLFEFSTENAISTAGVTSTAACYYYIQLIPSSSECSVQFSTVTPTWRIDYQGYYENSTSVNRVIGETYFTGIDYVDKNIYFSRGVMEKDYVSGYSSFTFSGGLSTTLIVNVDGYIRELTSVRIPFRSLATGGSPIVTSYVVYSTFVELALAKLSTLSYETSVFVSGVNY